jgi:HemY protein
MRRLFAVALVALLLGVGIVAIIETDPGYVLLAYGNYTLEASLWVGLLLLLLLMAMLFLLLRLTYQIITGQRSLVSWLGARKSRKALRLSSRGLISYMEGNWLVARRQLVRGAQHNEAPLLNYLLAARASAQLQDDEGIQENLRAASDAEPGAAMAVEISLAEIKLHAGQYSQAIAALNHATRSPGRHPRVLSLLLQAYQGLSDWDKQLELLPQLQKHKVLSSEEIQQLERVVQHNRLELCQNDLEQLRACWVKMPKPLQNDAAFVAMYARNLVALSEHGAAEKVILSSLKKEWHPSLVRLYAYVQTDSSRQLDRAESWLRAHPEDTPLLLCLGRLSARAELWGKARDYFESAYRLEHSAEVCAELGRLLDGLGEPTVAAAYFREGLMLQEDKLPALPQPEKVISDSRVVASI